MWQKVYNLFQGPALQQIGERKVSENTFFQMLLKSKNCVASLIYRETIAFENLICPI